MDETLSSPEAIIGSGPAATTAYLECHYARAPTPR
jgi:hypothetical protein